MTRNPAIPRRKPLTARVGVYGVGHHAYWPQFEGLLEQLKEKLHAFEEKVRRCGVEVLCFGIADNAESAYALVPRMKAANLDLLFCDMLTYATSSAFGVVIREIDVPVVLVGLQPLKAIEYSKATTHIQLWNDDICAMPEFAGVAARMGKPIPHAIIGTLRDDPIADAEIAEYCQIAKVLHDLKRARIGHFGHVLESMLDMHSDPTLLTAAFGCHIVQTEPDDILRQYRRISDMEIKSYEKEILDFFDTPDPQSDPITRKLTKEDLREAAHVSAALERFIDEKKLDGLAYYYEAEEGSPMRRVVTNLIVGNSLLTAAGFPMCGESDLKTCVAMMILDRLEIGGSFAEFHPIDFEEGFVLVGHDGPHHINIAHGKPLLRSLLKYHGKPGSGASVEFKIREGPVTMLCVTQTYQGRVKFVIGEGESVEGPVTPIGNTNTRGYFKPDVRTFLKRWLREGPTHHFALGVGHRAKTIQRIGEFLNIESVIVSNRPED